MRFRIFLLVCTLVFLPVLTQSEILYLKDGSSIQGTLKRLVNDTLYFETSFGSSIRVPRTQVMRIDFADSLSAQRPADNAAAIPTQISVPGTLMVSFENVKLSSKVSVHRGKDEDAILRANRIECSLYVGPDKVYSQVDSVTDKTIREGPETRFQNEMRPRDFKVAIAPGSYQCRFFIGNVVPEGYEESFVGGPLDKRLIVDDVEVLPSGTTQVRIGVKRKMKVGSPQLVVFE